MSEVWFHEGQSTPIRRSGVPRARRLPRRADSRLPLPVEVGSGSGGSPDFMISRIARQAIPVDEDPGDPGTDATHQLVVDGPEAIGSAEERHRREERMS